MKCAGLLEGAIIAAALLQPARAQTQDDHGGRHNAPAGELVFFLHGEAHRVSAAHTPVELSEDAAVAADIVLAITRDRFRLFGEYLASSRERELERLQVGYEPLPETIVWVGRFHQPASAWNTEHHHGRYLQTSITRPSIELWEDEQGTIPQHVTGLLVEARPALGDAAGLQLAFGVGIGPRIGGEGRIDPFDLLDMHTGSRRTSWSGRLAYLPDYVGATAIGVLAARQELPVVDDAVAAALEATRVRQRVYGAFADWRREPWRVIAAAYGVYLSLEGTRPRRENFLAGYAQAERQLPRGFTVYARHENSARAARSTFLAVGHPGFDLRRTTLGLRSDFRPRMALTLELARAATLQGWQNEFRLQWSAALP